MRRMLRNVTVAAFVLLAPGAASASIAAPSRLLGGATYDAAGTTHLYALVNAHRAAMGLRPLTVDARLARIAYGWSMTMATTGNFTHNDALFTTATHQALGIRSFGENVAYSSVDVDDAHRALLASPHHRANIENPAYAVAGFAVANDSRGWVWVTEDFGSPVVSAPRPAPAPVAPRPVQPVARIAAPRPAAPKPAPAPAPVRAVVRPVARPVVAHAVAPAPRAGRAAAAEAAPLAVPGSWHGGLGDGSAPVAFGSYAAAAPSGLILAAAALALACAVGGTATRTGRLAA